MNYNAVVVRVRPSALGKPALVELYPPNSHVKIKNSATTAKGGRARIGVKSVTTSEGTEIVVTGSIGVNSDEFAKRKRIDNPALYAGSILKSALVNMGVRVTGSVSEGQRPSGTQSLVLHESHALLDHLFKMNKWSNNFIAEQVFRLVGADGDGSESEVARARIAAFLKQAGIESGYEQMNGSGLYTGNRFSARHFVKLLDYMVEHRFAPDFMATLPISGVDGTLRKRLKSDAVLGRVRAKTGTLNQVSALSGYFTSKSGRLYAFSVLFDETKTKGWLLRGQQDAIVAAMVENAP